MQRIMQEDAAVFRTAETLNNGKRRLSAVFDSFAGRPRERSLADLEH